MANEVVLSNLTDATVIDYVEQEAVLSGYNKQVFRPVLDAAYRGHVRDFTGKGDTKLVAQTPSWAMADLTEATAQANIAFNPTGRSLIPVLVGGKFLVSWEANELPELSTVQMIIDEAANSWASFVDSDSSLGYAAQYGEAAASPDHEIGVDATAYTAALVRQGVVLLMAAKAGGPYNLFLDPIQVGELWQDSTALSLLKDQGAQPAGFRAVEGVDIMSKFVGKLFGCNIWMVQSGMIESSGLHSMMVGRHALGYAFKKISTPLSPTPSELNVDIRWEPAERAYTVALTICFQASGTAFTATTNKFMVDLIS